MYPYRGILRTDRCSDSLSTRPEDPNTPTLQSASTDDAPQGPDPWPCYMESFQTRPNLRLCLRLRLQSHNLCRHCDHHNHAAALRPHPFMHPIHHHGTHHRNHQCLKIQRFWLGLTHGFWRDLTQFYQFNLTHGFDRIWLIFQFDLTHV